MGLPLSKRDSIVYNSILIVVNKFIKIARYLTTKKIIIVKELVELFFFKISYKFSMLVGVVSD